MASCSQAFSNISLFSSLSTSTSTSHTVTQSTTNNKEVTNTFKKSIESKENSLAQHGTFKWPSGACYKGEFFDGRRNGHGVQTWPDCSIYDGKFFNDMRHGFGKHQWSSGEVYEGHFFKDHRHGKGIYSWPDGTKFEGKFYLDRKEGYGTFIFANGDKFEGLYQMDERFGPGVLTYKNLAKGQEVGIWYRKRLLKLCIPAKHIFTMENHPEYQYYPEEHKTKIKFFSDYDSEFHKVFARESSSYTFLSNEFKNSLFAENTALPVGLESYSSNFENLPMTYKHKDDFDKSFFNVNYDQMKSASNIESTATNNTPLFIEVEKHVLKHQSQSFDIEFDIQSIMSASRDNFNSKPGHLEKLSQSLIDMAAEGNEQMVYSVLKTGLVDPNVSDNKGNTALIGAAINCHYSIVNLLLDMGANVNQLTDEGMCALTACHIFYYPIDHFKPNGPEDSVKRYQNRLNKKSGKSMKFKASNTNTKQETAATKTNLNVQSTSESSLDAGDMEKAETCRSDLKIMKSRHLLTPQRKKVKLLKRNDPEMEGDIATDSFSEKPSFVSNRNVVHLDIDVTDRLIDQTATLLSLNEQLVAGTTTRDGQAINLGTPAALAVWKAEHSQLHAMIKLLLQRGANPNVGTVPYPALFFAVKAGDVEAVDHLLEKGASTEHKLSKQLLGLNMLHVAAGIRCPEGVPIVQSLLKANADPDVTAADEHINFELPKRKKSTSAADDSAMECSSMSSNVSNKPTPSDQDLTGESGRTPLHFACMRDDDYESCREIVRLLLYHGADPDVNWSGFSPLTLAITSGSDLCIDELLRGGADPSFQLTRDVPTALCAASNIKYEHRRNIQGRMKLIDKLISHGADILAPVRFGPKKLVGSVVDYAHWMFMSDRHIAHTPYHALTTDERELYSDRRTLLSRLGDILRNAAVDKEHQRLLDDFKDASKTESSTNRRFLYAGTRPELQARARASLALKSGPKPPPSTFLGASSEAHQDPGISISRVSFVGPEECKPSANGIIAASNNKEKKKSSHQTPLKKDTKRSPSWKPLFRYCYDCGRSVGVRLTACSRCHEVFFCSRACKLKSWEDRHKDECLRVKVQTSSSTPTPSEVAAIFADHSLDETMERARAKTESIIDAVLDKQLLIAEENLLQTSRKSMLGSRRQSLAHSAATTGRPRGHEPSAKSRRSASSKKSTRFHHSAKNSNTKKSSAKLTKYTRAKVGKDISFGTTGMTLSELGITENYSFE